MSDIKTQTQNLRALKEEEREAARQAEADALRGGSHLGPRKPSQSPIDVSGALLSAIGNSNVDVRLYWQDHYDGPAQEWAAEHGVPVSGCVPNVFGERGGIVPQWGICGRVTIQLPEDEAAVNQIISDLSAEGATPHIIEGNIVVNGYRIAAGFAKAGFPAHS